MSLILETKQVSKLYHSGSTPVLALDQVTCSVKKGSFFAITGPSGAGKSTLLNVMAGLEKPDHGSVVIAGIPIYTLSESRLARFRNRQIGYIFQAFNLVRSMNILDNCRLPQYIAGLKPDLAFEKEVFDQLGLNARLTFFPDELSGGEQQRAAIARAVLMRPALVIADEPTGNLDSKNSQHFMNLIRQMNAQFGQTLVLVTHDLDLASQADRIISLHDGRISHDSQEDQQGVT